MMGGYSGGEMEVNSDDNPLRFEKILAPVVEVWFIRVHPTRSTVRLSSPEAASLFSLFDNDTTI